MSEQKKKLSLSVKTLEAKANPGGLCTQQEWTALCTEAGVQEICQQAGQFDSAKVAAIAFF